MSRLTGSEDSWEHYAVRPDPAGPGSRQDHMASFLLQRWHSGTLLPGNTSTLQIQHPRHCPCSRSHKTPHPVGHLQTQRPGEEQSGDAGGWWYCRHGWGGYHHICRLSVSTPCHPCVWRGSDRSTRVVPLEGSAFQAHRENNLYTQKSIYMLNIYWSDKKVTLLVWKLYLEELLTPGSGQPSAPRGVEGIGGEGGENTVNNTTHCYRQAERWQDSYGYANTTLCCYLRSHMISWAQVNAECGYIFQHIKLKCTVLTLWLHLHGWSQLIFILLTLRAQHSKCQS